jgi:hypothetical protein
MNRLAAILGIIAAVPSCLGTASAQSVLQKRFGIDASVGTVGLDANAQVALHDRVALRAGASWLAASVDDFEESGVSFDAEAERLGVGGYVDLHPFANPFTLTGGVFVGDSSADLDALPLEDVTLGDVTFTPEQVGALDGEASFGDAAFFAGLGWDPTLYSKGRLSFVARAGVMFMGDAEVELTAERLADDPTGELAGALAAEAAEIEDEIEDFAYYPVLTVGLSYGF